MKNVTIFGTGYVGLVTGVCLAEFGLNAVCYDIDMDKIQTLTSGNLPIYEPDLNELLTRNREYGRLHFTGDAKKAVESSETIFIAVGTPPQEDGSADLNHVLSAAKTIGEHLEKYALIVIKSTVPVGTCRKIKQTIKQVLDSRGKDIEFDIVSNPEFLREGVAVKDFMKPDRIIIGTENERARKKMQSIYNILYLTDTPFVFTNLETSELTKYASNAFLATKISFINQISNLCEAIGANVEELALGMGLDSRIGRAYLKPGPGYGGSCFPKDTKALLRIGDANGAPQIIVNSVVISNEHQKKHMVNKIVNAISDVKGKTIAILGLAFKPETDDMREAPSIVIIEMLLGAGAILRAYDPEAMGNSKAHFFNDNQINYCDNEYDAVTGADAVVVLTEWNQFKMLDFDELKCRMKGNAVFDFRNIFDAETIKSKGFNYYRVGQG